MNDNEVVSACRGNGAREALISILKPDISPSAADWILGELLALGFKVVPLDKADRDFLADDKDFN